MTYVAMRAVPMGWTNSVALLQNFLRNLLYRTIGVPRGIDVNPRQRVLRGDAVVACMDGADYLTRLRQVGTELRRWDGVELPGPGERHPVMQKFVDVCGKLGLPVNAAKRVVQDFDGAILGGELDGVRGALSIAPEKGHKFVGKTCALLSVPKASQVACQHWCGLFCFAAGFRRPLFAVLEQIFGFIVKMEDPGIPAAALPNAVQDEILVTGLLLPLASTNLRAPLRQRISITDASEFGGAAAEASRFISAVDENVQMRACNLQMNALEEAQVQASQFPLECPTGRVKEVTTLISEVSPQLAPTRTAPRVTGA